MKRIKKNNGFTLIELLVSISIIGILSTMVLANLNAARERGRDVQRKSDVRNIQTSLGSYYNDAGIYPFGSASFQIIGCNQGGGSVSACTWDNPWQANNTSYMPVLPGDPIDSQSYRYIQNDLDSYTIQACLENQSDDSGVVTTATSWCPSGWMYEVLQN